MCLVELISEAPVACAVLSKYLLNLTMNAKLELGGGIQRQPEELEIGKQTPSCAC